MNEKMETDNCALISWMREIGKVRRKIILRKLKKDLEDKGMTSREVYKGLVQLASNAQILLPRLCISEFSHLRSHVIADTVQCENSPFLHNVQPDAVDTVGNEKPEVSAIRTNEGPENSAPPREPIKSATPELLDEIVGNESPFLVKIPRSAITLNLQSYAPVLSKKNNPQARPSPEIRIADSSVADIENTRESGVKCNYRGNIEDEHSVKKPKIIEDVTCLEGTIIPLLSLSKVPKILENPPKIRKSYNEHREKRKRNNENYKLSDERTLSTTKKSRLRRKFRQLFGNELTLSEVEEEDSMIDRFVRKKRRKCNSRISQDSGVFLSDLACSEEISIEKRSNCTIASNTLEISFENYASVGNFSLNEEKCDVDSDKNLRSMPSLDLTFESVCQENLSENLPDSTNTEEKSSKAEVTTADSSNDEKMCSKGKLTILISPVDAESPNAFTPLSLEINLAGESQISTPTSTTGYLSISQPEKNISTDDTLKTFDIDAQNDTCNITLQGQTLNVQADVDMNVFMTESPPSTPEPGEHLIIDESSNLEDPNGKNDNIDKEKVPFPVIDERKQEQEAPMDLCSRTREIERVEESTRTETKDDDNFGITSSVESTGRIANAVNITGNIENGVENPGYVASGVEITQNIANGVEISQNIENNEHCLAPPPAPKFRVLHHHELGSRWCPTPLNDSPVLVDAQNFQSQIPPITPIAPILPSQNLQGPSVSIQQPSSLKYLHQMSTNTIFPNLSNLRNLPQHTLVNSPSSASNSPSISSTLNEMNKEPERSMLNIIFSYLIPLHSYIEQNKLPCNSYNYSQLRNQFAAKKQCLWIEWGKFCSLINTSNIERAVCIIVRFYEFFFLPGNRILNITRVMEILYMKELPLQEINLDRGTAPPPYPGTFYVPRNSSQSYVTQNVMTQQPFRANREPPRTEIFHTSRILTEDQLRTFHNQVAIYNKLAKSISQQLKENSVREKRQRRPRKKAAPLENDTKKTGGKGQDRFVDKVEGMFLRALLEPQQSSETVNRQGTILSGHPATQQSFDTINQGQTMFRMQPETRTSPEMINQQETISMVQREIQKSFDTINREQTIFRRHPETRTSPETINQQETISMVQRETQKSFDTINREQTIFRRHPETRTSPETINQQGTIFRKQQETQISPNTINREQTILRMQPETRISPETINQQGTIFGMQQEIQKSLNTINREQTILRMPPETRTSPEPINQQETIFRMQQETQKSLNMINREQTILRMQPETRTNPETINQQETIFRMQPETRTSLETINQQRTILMVQQETQKSLDTVIRKPTMLRIQPETRGSPETINRPEINTTTENCNETGNGLTVSLNYGTVGITDVLQELTALWTKNTNDNTKKIELPSNSECGESSMIPGGSSGCSEMRKIITTDMHEESCVDETEEIQKSDDSVICSNDDDNLVEKVNDGDEKNCNNNENSNNNDEQVDDESSEMRQFDVITLDVCESNESVKTQDAASIEEEQTFSILEVKSISKDVFNSMNGHDDVNEVCDNTVEEEQEQEIVTPLPEWSDCFHCGEPSSVVCERCYLAFYCSAECHEAHWTESHHLQCQPVPVETLAELESCDRSS